LDHLNAVVQLVAGPIHSGDPALPGIIDTGIGHQQVLVLFDPHSLVIQQYLYGLSPEPLIDIEAEVMEPNLPLLTPLAGLLTEGEDPSEAGRFDHAAPRAAQNDL
jgi:hypothetical protein